MINPRLKAGLENFGTTSVGKEFLKHLKEKRDNLDKVRNLKSWEETVSRQKEIQVLEGFIALFEKSNPQRAVEKVTYT